MHILRNIFNLSPFHKKALYISFFCLLFYKIFIISWDIGWSDKFKVWGVPANFYAGGDARNIQVSAHCARFGYAYYVENECFIASSIVKNLYPEAGVPKLNYPSIWPKIYSLFNDDSEHFFRMFWGFNATLIISGIALLCLKTNYKLFPFLIFNPIVLLAIERGNVDGITFFFTFVPLMIFSSKKIQGFFLGFSSALKIFPIFSIFASINMRSAADQKNYLIGYAISSPILLLSLLEIPHLLKGTAMGFSTAYGLLSLRFYEGLEGYSEIIYLLIGACFLSILIAVSIILKSKKLSYDLELDIRNSSENSLFIASISVYIYLATFFLFTNWAYRLIFLIPILLFCYEKKSLICNIILWNIFLILWIPLLKNGWYYQNIACYLLTIPLTAFILILTRMKIKKDLSKEN
jgi:hypothetical protein